MLNRQSRHGFMGTEMPAERAMTVPKTKKATLSRDLFHWCRKWDSNPHAFKGGGF
jgi:hypothetical protein